jgi:hypothetical protein
MTSFELYSGLAGAQLKVFRKGQTEVLDVKRPFYRDVLEVKWAGTRYTVIRTGVIVRHAQLYREGSLIGELEEKIGVMTHFDVTRAGAGKAFDIHEEETFTKQEFKILQKGQVVGTIRPIGIYVPILSNIGKGVQGEYYNVSKADEELLLLSTLAIGV